MDNVTDGVITGAPPGGYISTDYSLLNWRSDINTVDYLLCFFDETCPLYFSFNDAAIGNKVFLTPDIEGQQNPAYAISSTTIINDVRYQNSIYTPLKSVPDKTNYCLYMQDSIDGDILRCGTTIEWIASSSFGVSRFAKDPCAEVPLPDGAWDQLRYGVECGMKRIVFFIFNPDPATVQDFAANSGKLKKIFPFNTYYQLTDAVNAGISAGISATSSTFGIPFIDKSGSFYILPVLASSSMANTIGNENTNIFRTTIIYALWIFAAALIFIQIRNRFI
jgi:hypothetical protein